MTREEFQERIRRRPFGPFRVVHRVYGTAEVFSPRGVLMMDSHVLIGQPKPDRPDRNTSKFVDWSYADLIKVIELPHDAIPTGVIGVGAGAY